MRGGRASDGVRVFMHNPLQFGQAGVAVGSGAPAREYSCGALCSHIGVKIRAIARSRGEARPDHELAEVFAWLALFRIGCEQRIERRDAAIVLEVLGMEF